MTRPAAIVVAVDRIGATKPSEAPGIGLKAIRPESVHGPHGCGAVFTATIPMFPPVMTYTPSSAEYITPPSPPWAFKSMMAVPLAWLASQFRLDDPSQIVVG